MPCEAGEELGIVHGADFFDSFQLFSAYFLCFCRISDDFTTLLLRLRPRMACLTSSCLTGALSWAPAVGELLGLQAVLPEGLLDDDAVPAARGPTALPQLLHSLREEERGQRLHASKEGVA